MIVAILGAGPAGMSCANACLSFGLTPVVVERSEQLGGAQRDNFHANLWMLGYPEESGETMCQRLAEHFRALPLLTHHHTRVKGVTRQSARFRLALSGMNTPLEANAIVVATGTRPRGTPELEKLASETQHVIIGPLSHTIRDDIRGANVLILGGGDNALDHALYLAERRNHVVVCTRAGLSARKPFIDSCLLHPAIDLRPNCPPPRVTVEGGHLVARWPGRERKFDWLLAMYGYLPSTEVLEAFAPEIRPALSDRGYLQVDAWQRTSVPRIYAAGDITDSPQPSVPTAMAQGLTAARAAERDLMAS
jgi:thioredoxin reductase